MRILAALAIVGLLVSPAWADLTPSSLTPMAATGLDRLEGQGTVGPFAPPSGIYFSYQVSILPSGTGSVTFAFHWPYATTVYAVQMHSALLYDNNEVAITSTTAQGLFAVGNNNFPSATSWAGTGLNPTAGTWVVGDVLGTGVPLWCNPMPTGTAGLIPPAPPIAGSGVYPFMKVDFHVKDFDPGDSLLDVMLPSAALLFWLSPSATATYWTAGSGLMWTTTTTTTPTYGGTVTHQHSAMYGIDVVPEPGSLGLLLAGAACISGGILRRRR